MLPPMDDLVMTVLEQAPQEFHGDAQHIYLTELSMGGFGAWHLARKYPGSFAALVVICGICPPAAAKTTYPDLAKLMPPGATLPQPSVVDKDAGLDLSWSRTTILFRTANFDGCTKP
jgi:poly(3-hydroxybutyrate) depolymerase